MRKNVVLLILAVMLTSISKVTAAGKGQAIQIATLKNGSVLYGYIQSNNGYGKFVFHTDSAIIVMNNVVADVTDKTVDYAQLTAQWKNWADCNDAYSELNSNKTLTLSDISIRSVPEKDNNFLRQIQSKAVKNVMLQERGVNYKYVEMESNTYELSWNDITSITAERRPKTVLSGIDLICQTKNGQSFEGQYAGETKTTKSLYLNNGVKQTINKDDIVKYTYCTINDNQNVFEQSELIDIVQTSNAGTITGVIIEQNYTSSKDVDNYILIQLESGTFQSIRMSEIEKISRERNSKYSPEYDVILKIGEVYINGKEAVSDSVTFNKNMNVLKTLNPSVIEQGLNNLTTVQVQYNASVIGDNIEAFRVVPLKKEGQGKNEKYFFTSETLATSVYRPVSIRTSVNQTTKAVYQLNGTGYFLFYDGKEKIGYSVQVVNP